MNVTLTIDGRRVEVPQGNMILDAARSAGIEIPALCAHEALEPWGGCRLCVVEITKPGWDDWRKLVASCLYPVEEGLVVYTSSERVMEVRRTVLDLLLARAPGSETIRELARQHGVIESSFEPVADADRCIMCGLCYRICDALGISAIAPASRGFDRYVTLPYDQVSDACIGCLACAHICPTDNIPFEEDGKTRRIWDREFRLVACQKCGRAFITEEQLAYHVEQSGLPRETFLTCDRCKRAELSQTIQRIGAWTEEER